MALQFKFIPKTSQGNLKISFPKFSSNQWPCFASFKNPSVSKSYKACLKSPKSCSQENYRPLANFSPCIWKDTFASISFPYSELESYEEQVGELKEKVEEMFIATTKDPTKNIILIDSLCRLGVAYHFETQIEQQLNHVSEWQASLPTENDYDLNTIAIMFRVLRQHGFKMSCDMFNKFKDNNGGFKESLISDVHGMLSLYEASHLSFRGEEILDEALDFTKAHLTSLASNSTPHLAQHIFDALKQPLHTCMARIKIHKYISFYEHEDSRNETLLMLAKLDFNRVQIFHRQELSYLTSWWKDLNFKSTHSYSRDRLVETYLYSLSKYYEPRYSRVRTVYSKLMMFLTLIDDTYDAYGTLEEIQAFTDAIERTDIEAPFNQLPDYKAYSNCTANAWKDINKECMRPTTIPFRVMTAITNVARTVETIYRDKDGVTNPEYSKHFITKLFIHRMHV